MLQFSSGPCMYSFTTGHLSIEKYYYQSVFKKSSYQGVFKKRSYQGVSKKSSYQGVSKKRSYLTLGPHIGLLQCLYVASHFCLRTFKVVGRFSFESDKRVADYTVPKHSINLCLDIEPVTAEAMQQYKPDIFI